MIPEIVISQKQFIRLKDLNNQYKFDNSLLINAKSKFLRAESTQTSKFHHIKIYPKTHTEEDDYIFCEVDKLSTLVHPNIPKIYDFLEDEGFYYVVQEELCGGRISDVMESAILCEFDIKKIMFQLFYMINYCHTHHNMAIRNVSLDNIYCLSKDFSQIKYTDWKNARVLKNGVSFSTIYGNAQYIAPEMFSRKYDLRSDLWSLGIILFWLLFNSFPYQDLLLYDNDNVSFLLENILNVGEHFKPNYLNESMSQRDEVEYCINYFQINDIINDKLKSVKYEISDDSLDLLRKLLVKDPNKRISCLSALRHHFFNELIFPLEKYQISKSLSAFDIKSPTKSKIMVKNEFGFGILLRMVYCYVAHFVQDTNDRKKMEIFQYLDSDLDGYVTKKDLSSTIAKIYGHKFACGLVDNIFMKIDLDMNNYFDYHEFCFALDYNKPENLSEENIKLFFNQIKQEFSDTINTDDIKDFLGPDNDFKLFADEIYKFLNEEGNDSLNGTLELPKLNNLISTIK